MDQKSRMRKMSRFPRRRPKRFATVAIRRDLRLVGVKRRGVDVESVPKDDDIYDQSERSEPIFLSFMISLAEFARFPWKTARASF
jgi:hypothetical protein